ncbi:MAG: MBL fold metallo-hydrolase [Dehalococcoidia bacterium]|nr:MBL fold metallo-hydrolase [Dehalococcoidia bacterium]
MQIAPGVRLTPSADLSFTGTYAPNVYLVGTQKVALIDAGYGNVASVRTRLEYVDSLGCPKPDFILVTHAHPDHLGGAKKISEATGARVLLHTADGTSGAESVVDGSQIHLGEFRLTVIHTPGHTPGSICIMMEPGRVLFSGDSILGLGTTVVVPPGGNMADYVKSLEKLLAMDISLVCPGHGPLVKEPRRKIVELLDHRLERERQVLEAMKRGKSTVDGLIAAIYPELDKRLFSLARWQVLAQIDKLVHEGKVRSVAADTYQVLN